VDSAALAMLGLLGLLLLPMRFAQRACVIGVLAIALVFCAIYWPLAVWNLSDRTLILPLLIVAGLWAIQFFAWTLPNQARDWRRSRPPKEPSPPAAAVGEPEPDTPVTAESVEGSDAQDRAEGGQNDD